MSGGVVTEGTGNVTGYVTATRSEIYVNNSGNTNSANGHIVFASLAENSNVERSSGVIAQYTLKGGDSRNIANYRSANSYQNTASVIGDVIGYHYEGLRNTTSQAPNVEHHYGIKVENVAYGKKSNYAIHTGDGKVRVGDLASSGAGDRVVYADENGVLKAGGDSSVKLGANANKVCNVDRVGTIHYEEVNGSGVFGFCIKRGDNYVWAYIKGGSNIFGTSASGATFGSGL